MGDVLIVILTIFLLLFSTIGGGLIYRFTKADEGKNKKKRIDINIDFIRQPRFLVETFPQEEINICNSLGLDWKKILQEWRLENKSFSYTIEEKKQLMQLSSRQRRHKIYVDYIRQPRFLHEPFEERFLFYAKKYNVNVTVELKKWREENGITVIDTTTLITDKQKQTKHETKTHTYSEIEVMSLSEEKENVLNNENKSNSSINSDEDELRRF